MAEQRKWIVARQDYEDHVVVDTTNNVVVATMRINREHAGGNFLPKFLENALNARSGDAD